MDGSSSGGDEAWSVEDGVITFDGSTRQPHLVTAREFFDFELWVGWRSLERDFQGGIFLRSDAHDGGTRSWISLSTKDAGRMLGAHVAGSTPSPGLLNPPGEWNLFRIVALGSRVGLWCNRQCAWNAATLDKPRGRIGLRGDGRAFECRFVHLREVKRK